MDNCRVSLGILWQTWYLPAIKWRYIGGRSLFKTNNLDNFVAIVKRVDLKNQIMDYGNSLNSPQNNLNLCPFDPRLGLSRSPQFPFED